MGKTQILQVSKYILHKSFLRHPGFLPKKCQPEGFLWCGAARVSYIFFIFLLLNFLHLPQQFFKHDFSETHVRTTKPFRYRSCLVCDTMIRELIVLDVPPQVSGTIIGSAKKSGESLSTGSCRQLSCSCAIEIYCSFVSPFHFRRTEKVPD